MVGDANIAGRGGVKAAGLPLGRRQGASGRQSEALRFAVSSCNVFKRFCSIFKSTSVTVGNELERAKEMAMRSGDEMLQQIIEKSALDEDFRQALLADPKTTISGELGITIPESMTIKVHESDMQTVHLALPPDPNITEEQLEAISAGLCCCW
ncbi:MAG: NHLP leader peptide family RiPP precursor [Gammaproteobacteria bacterium]|nr:NHLP leader peptide family RiPP precursor [Gammaproteobacteria bacterium]